MKPLKLPKLRRQRKTRRPRKLRRQLLILLRQITERNVRREQGARLTEMTVPTETSETTDALRHAHPGKAPSAAQELKMPQGGAAIREMPGAARKREQGRSRADVRTHLQRALLTQAGALIRTDARTIVHRARIPRLSMEISLTAGSAARHRARLPANRRTARRLSNR